MPDREPPCDHTAHVERRRPLGSLSPRPPADDEAGTPADDEAGTTTARARGGTRAGDMHMAGDQPETGVC